MTGKAMQIWGITGGRRGNDVLVEGIAQALGGDFRLLHAHLPRPFQWLAPYRPALLGVRQDPQITPPWPDLVIASGRQAVPHARYIRRAAKGKTFVAFLQDPHIRATHFDFVWTPAHDQNPNKSHDPKIMRTILSPHGLTRDAIAAQADAWRDTLIPAPVQQQQRKIVSVILGGPSQAYAFDDASMTQLAQQLGNLAAQNCFLLITLSRRSPARYGDILRQYVSPENAFLWDNQGPNPYLAMLGLGDHFVVTADSANMVGEACLAGKPVHVFDLPGGSAKFQRFHASLRQQDWVRPFTGELESWPVSSQNATPEIAAALLDAMQQASDAKNI
jgi:mitochondrial fission protein ELM1